MPKWMLLTVARPGTEAVNQRWPEHAPPRKVTIERFGTYTRVVLVAEHAAPIRPWVWA